MSLADFFGLLSDALAAAYHYDLTKILKPLGLALGFTLAIVVPVFAIRYAIEVVKEYRALHRHRELLDKPILKRDKKQTY